MRIITEDNIDQLTSMSYKNSVEIMKDKVLTNTQKSEFNKIVKSRVVDKKTPKKISKRELEAKEEKPLEEEEIDEDDIQNDDDDIQNDDDDLDPITIEAVKKAELDFEKSQLEDSDNEDEPRPSLTIGERMSDVLDDFVETLTGSPEETLEDTREIFEKKVMKVEQTPELEKDSIFRIETEKTNEVVKNNDTSDPDTAYDYDDKNSSFTFDNKSSSENRKTIKIDNQ